MLLAALLGDLLEEISASEFCFHKRFELVLHGKVRLLHPAVIPKKVLVCSASEEKDTWEDIRGGMINTETA